MRCRWYKDWNRGWVVQQMDPFDKFDESEFYLPESYDLQEDYERIKIIHPIPFTQEMEDDLRSFHGLD